MARPVDLPRARRALAELDKIAAEHPELRHQGQPWSSDLKQLRKAIMTPAKQRMTEYRARQKAKGLKEIAIFLTPEGMEALNLLLETAPDTSKGDLISSALVAAAAKIKPKAPPTPAPVPVAPVLIPSTEAARRLQISTAELNRWRHEGRGPKPYYRKDRVLYDEIELDQWLAEERRQAEEDTADFARAAE